MLLSHRSFTSYLALLFAFLLLTPVVFLTPVEAIIFPAGAGLPSRWVKVINHLPKVVQAGKVAVAGGCVYKVGTYLYEEGQFDCVYPGVAASSMVMRGIASGEVEPKVAVGWALHNGVDALKERLEGVKNVGLGMIKQEDG